MKSEWYLLFFAKFLSHHVKNEKVMTKTSSQLNAPDCINDGATLKTVWIAYLNCDIQISYEMVSNSHMHRQLTVSLWWQLKIVWKLTLLPHRINTALIIILLCPLQLVQGIDTLYPPDKSLSRGKLLGKPIPLSSRQWFIRWKSAIDPFNNRGAAAPGCGVYSGAIDNY